MIRKGDVLRIRPDWQDLGDDRLTFVAMEDEDGGRVLIKAIAGLAINPTQVVSVYMVEVKGMMR